MNEEERNAEFINDNNLEYKSSDIDYYESKRIEFPKEFRKSIFGRIDRCFATVLVGSLVAHTLIVIYFLMNPLPKSDVISKLTTIQKQIAKNILEQKERKDTPIARFELRRSRALQESAVEEKEGTKLSGKSASKRKSTKRTGKPRGTIAQRGKAGRGVGRKTKEQIAATIGSKGILALLTSTSSAARGEEVEDILGISVDTQQDLDKALATLSGIKKGGTPVRGKGGSGNGGAGVKGGRTGNGGDIDVLVSGLGDTKASSFERSGELVVVSESPLIEGNGEKGILGRNQDDVQAVVLKHKNAIQYCYERALKRNPNLRGKLIVRFIISPQGSVKYVKILSSTINNRKVEQCVVNRIRRWNDFGAIELRYGDTAIRQVFVFGY
ncbi:MAG: AgmX/PglI C-terminal domain-containing protein [bacterium]